MRKRLAGILDDIAAASIVIVGDVMLDRYIIGDSHRISPEAPEPIIEERERTALPGGAANVAVNAVSLGAKAALFSVVGQDEDAAEFRRSLDAAGVDTTGVTGVADRPTTRKTRLIARGNQVLRVDRETRAPIGDDLTRAMADAIAARPETIVVVSDYAKGVVSPALVKMLVAAGKRLIVDPKSPDFSLYRGAFLVTPNYAELCRAAGADDLDRTGVEQAARRLMVANGITAMLVTLGADGMLLVEGDRPATHAHTRAREVFDVTGAGDTVIATVASAAAAGVALADACHVATIAAGIVVGKHRTASVRPAEIMAYAFGASSAEKIIDRATAAARIGELRRAGRRVVFTNGCFDLLHVGHITYLNDARNLGDVLIVGLNTDASVQRLKGPSRPIIPESERSHVLAALECVEYVVLFDEDTPLDLIGALRPDVLVKGADYTREQVVGGDVVESYGGTVALVPVVDSVSTSAIIKRIKESS